jgi:ubiquinone/menaquinone biosynthesis C-methylase UbiE
VSEILHRNVWGGNRRQYQGKEIWPYAADVRRDLYLKYALDPALAAEGKVPRDMWDEMAERLDLLKDKRILDVGTGSGYFLRKLLDRGHRGILDGVDTADWHLEHLQDFLREEYNHPLINLEYGDAQDLPFADNSMDATVAPFIIYHLPRPRKLFSEAHRVTKPGGLAMFSARDVDNTYNLWTIARIIAMKHNATMLDEGPFYSHFPLEELLKAVKQSKKYELVDYVEQEETIWIPNTEEGWSDYREAIFSLLPHMRFRDGRQLRKTDVLDYLESNEEFNIRRDVFSSIASEFDNDFPDYLYQGLAVASVIK